jgi:hypothetical protein
MQLTERGLDMRLKFMHPASYQILNRNPIWARYGGFKMRRRLEKLGLTEQTAFPWMKVETRSGEVWYSEDGDAWFPLCWTEE